MLNTCGQAQLMNQPPLSAPATSSTKMSSEARPTASRTPPASVLALLKILASAPTAGIKSQASTYSGNPQPADTRVASTNTIRTVVGLTPRQPARAAIRLRPGAHRPPPALRGPDAGGRGRGPGPLLRRRHHDRPDRLRGPDHRRRRGHPALPGRPAADSRRGQRPVDRRLD